MRKCWIVFVLLMLAVPVFAMTDTLPQGVWSFGLSHKYYDVSKIGGETIDYATKAGDEDFAFKPLNEYTARYINKYGPLIAEGYVNEDLRLLDSARLTYSYLDIAYGITNDLTFSFTLPYEDKTVKYSQEYIDTFTALNANPGLASAITVPPRVAKGSGLGDASMALKYRFMKNAAMAFKYQAGALKFGKDGTEIRDAIDGFEEIYTGKKEDRFTLAMFYDVVDVLPFKVGLMAAYEYSTTGYEKFMENDFSCDNGDVMTVMADTKFDLSKQISLKPKLIYLQAGVDKRYADTAKTWAPIEGTAVTALLADFAVHYHPVIFADLWASLTVPLHNKVAGGVYDFPGRLDTPAVVRFGVTVYYK